MLPGFRFLFAAIVLSTSMLIFGLGAAALLRAAHEEFASIPSRRAPPETLFAQRSDAKPALAMLRIDAPAVDQQAATSPLTDNAEIAASVQQPAIVSTPPAPEKAAAESDQIAGLTEAATTAEKSPPSEMPKLDAALPEIPAPAETPAQAGAHSPADETKIAAIAEAPAAPNDAEIAAPVAAAAPADDSARIAETRIATLGGPPVTIETQTPSKIAPAVARKSAQARHVVKRRRIAQRARVTQQAPQTPADPFARPLGR
jgi:hypothetical protein